MRRPALTVLVPAYQAEPFVQASLDAISGQTLEDFTAVVSVDLSDDATAEICRQHALRDPRFRVVEQPARLGWVGNSNFLLSQVQTEFAVFAFHDDLLAPACLLALTSALQRDAGAAVAFPDTMLTRTDGMREHWVYSELEGIDDPVTRGMHLLVQREKWWVPYRGVFRFAMASKIGGLKTHESGEFSADLPWLFHLSLYGRFVRVPETLCFKHYKPGSLSRSWTFGPRQKYDVLASCMRELWNAQIPVEQKLSLGIPLIKWLRANIAERNASAQAAAGADNARSATEP